MGLDLGLGGITVVVGENWSWVLGFVSVRVV